MSSKTLADLFGTSESLEVKGVNIDYGSFYITVARSGGRNTAYKDGLEKAFKPVMNQAKNNTLDDETANEIIQKVFINTVVKGWGSKKYGEGKVEVTEGNILEFSRENIAEVFFDYPDLYTDLKKQSEEISVFQDAEKEEDLKNSPNT